MVTGQITNDATVHPNKALQLRRQKWRNSKKAGRPEGFYQPIQTVIHSMVTTRKHIKVGEHKIINTEAIYACAMSLHNTSRDMEHTTLMFYELSPVPTAFFNGYGDMRLTTPKGTIQNALKVETAQRTQPRHIDVIVLVGCSVLWVIP